MQPSTVESHQLDERRGMTPLETGLVDHGVACTYLEPAKEPDPHPVSHHPRVHGDSRPVCADLYGTAS